MRFVLFVIFVFTEDIIIIIIIIIIITWYFNYF